MNIDKARIGTIGLGYVGLPLAVEFGKRFATVGFDLKQMRVDELRQGRDSTLETTAEEVASAEQLGYTTDPNDIASCNVDIVAVHVPCVASDEALTECVGWLC